jgi:hypothetical protein
MHDWWYQKLKTALQSPYGKDMEELLSLVRSQGVYSLRSFEVRQASTTVLREQDISFTKTTKFFLERLQNAGIQPSYPKYVALELLSVENTSFSSTQIAKDTLRLIYEFISHLLEIQELQDYERRKVLEQHANSVLEKCQVVLFSRDPANVPARDVIQFSLIPESGVSDELIFLRVVQGCELIFDTAKVLTDKAMEDAAYGEAHDTAGHLEWVVYLVNFLSPLLGLLAPMTVDRWHQFRPLIVQPSAIQSTNFHNLSAKLQELARYLVHPRYHPKHQYSYLPKCQELLQQAITLCRTWDKGHIAIATKYGGVILDPKSEGVQWLQNRRSPFPYEGK